MKKTILFASIFLVAFFTFISPLFAFTVKGGETVNLAESITDDVYVSGETVNVSGEIDGDLVAAGGRLNFRGITTGDLMAAGGILDINGNVKDDVRAAGGTLNIDGTINDDVIVAGGQVTVGSNAVIEGDLVFMGGTLNLNGEVKGKVIASGGQIDISGKVGNGVTIDRVDTLTIGGTADISGGIAYSSGNQAAIADGAVINGEVQFTEIAEQKKIDKSDLAAPMGILGWFFGASWIISKIVSFFAMFVLGIILLLVLPAIFKKFNNRMRTTLGFCVAGGAIMLFGVPAGLAALCFAGILLCITIIGAGLGLLLFASSTMLTIIYCVLIYTSTAFLAYFIGQLILSRTKINHEKYGWKVLSYLIGLAIIMAIYAIPFVGGLARFAGILFGFGGLIMLLKDWIWQAAGRLKNK
jgi:cytoskeletal protein CcmA (bactofilin family)